MNDRKVDLSAFTTVRNEVIAKTEGAWNSMYNNYYVHTLRDYSKEEIDKILNSSSLESQQKLSRNYYDKNGFYKRILLYYATLLNYSGLLIPNPSFGKQLSTPYIYKRYDAALAYLEKLNLSELFTRISLRILIDGTYYGIIQTLDKDNLIVFDLPASYCMSRFKDIYGNDVIEFNVTYFNSIYDDDARAEALKIFPKIVSSHYRKYKKGKVDSPWVKLPTDIGICFTFFDDGRPLFIDMIPATIQYDEAVDNERERELEEIRKIIVQRIPHLQDGQLLFEPEEALEMHRGAVNMMQSNKNLSILTTYADVDSVVSRTTNDNAVNAIEKMQQNVYANAGVSGQIFAPTGTQALPYSIKNDISLMMILGNKYARLVGFIVNTLFANANVNFTYLMLPVGEYNRSDYITDTLKLAQSGYSFLLPAAAAGLNQYELMNTKALENEVLKLTEVLIPLSSSYTQSTNPVGAPEKKLEDKAQKTIQNEDALNNQGGS